MFRTILHTGLLLCLPKTSTGIAVRGSVAAKSSDLVKYVLLGPFDAGTNLLEQFIEANWPETFVSSQDGHALWKHSNSGAADIYNVLTESGFGNISQMTALAMVRSPVSMVASWMHSPYQMEACVSRPVIEMDEPCFADLEARKAGERSRAGDTSVPHLIKFSSTMDVYNHYMQLYHDLGEDGKFASFLQINYEDLVYSPEVVVKLLADALGVDAPHVTLVKTPAKDHGDPTSLSGSLDKLRDHSYLTEIGDDGLKSLCPHLNVSLVSHLKEGTYLEENRTELIRPYTWDCEGFL
mmetsp:Transcript_50433/g.117719  ORF Transcript_50433/g.117719 Transcript_50433/m.117719 type:complete len:295 (-) Transcript_50433:60-944(-)